MPVDINVRGHRELIHAAWGTPKIGAFTGETRPCLASPDAVSVIRVRVSSSTSSLTVNGFVDNVSPKMIGRPWRLNELVIRPTNQQQRSGKAPVAC
jgi:hypothetical protein